MAVFPTKIAGQGNIPEPTPSFANNASAESIVNSNPPIDRKEGVEDVALQLATPINPLLSYWELSDAGTQKVTYANASSGAYTVPNGANLVVFETTAATTAITLCSNPVNGTFVAMNFVEGVSTSLSIVGNNGQSSPGNVPTTITAGNGLAFVYNSSNSTWYRVY